MYEIKDRKDETRQDKTRRDEESEIGERRRKSGKNGKCVK